MLEVTHLIGFGSGGGSGPATFVSSANYTGTATTHSVTLPSGIQAGDILVFVAYPTATSIISTMTGWTSVLNNAAAHVRYRVADGTEGSTVSVTLAGSRTYYALTGIWRPSAGIDGTPTSDTGTGNLTFPAVTTTVANSLLIVAFAANNQGTVSGFTERAYYAAGGGALQLFDKLQAASGSSGTVSTSGLSGSSLGGMLAAKPGS